MKHIKRLAGLCAALTLALSLSIGAFAAESPSVSGVVTGGTGTDADGNAVAITITEAVDSAAKAQLDDLKTVLGSDYTENMVVADVKEVTAPEGTVFPVQITFDVTGVTSGSEVIVLHHNGTEWEKVAVDAVGDGTVTATFESLSPVAIVVEKTAASATGTTSPKTGTSPVVMMAIFGAVICMAGAVVLTKKERA